VVQKSVRRNVESAEASNDTRGLGHSKSHKGTPALPFCHFKIKAEKPKDSRYPAEQETIGDRLRARRLDLGLYQKDVAGIIGVTVDTICYWENNRVRPSKDRTSVITEFLELLKT